MLAECDYPQTREAFQNTIDFKEAVKAEKNPQLPAKSTESAGFYLQVRAAVVRQFKIMWGDKATLFLKQGSATIQA